MKNDVHCPLIAEGRGKQSRAHYFNFDHRLCISRMKHQNNMLEDMRKEAGDCCNCETGQHIFWVVELGG